MRNLTITSQKRAMLSMYNHLEASLKITSGGYENYNYSTPVLDVEEFIEKKLKDIREYNSEFIIIPDGRVIPAEPSHALVQDSLLNFLLGEEFKLSPQWLVEERLYFTGCVSCWPNQQVSFMEPTNAQLETLKRICSIKGDFGSSVSQNISVFPDELTRNFEESYERIRKQTEEYYQKHGM